MKSVPAISSLRAFGTQGGVIFPVKAVFYRLTRLTDLPPSPLPKGRGNGNGWMDRTCKRSGMAISIQPLWKTV